MVSRGRVFFKDLKSRSGLIGVFFLGFVGVGSRLSYRIVERGACVTVLYR